MTTETGSTQSNVPPPVAMLNILSGYWLSRAVYIAAKLGLADLLKDGPRTTEQLAASTATHAGSLYRILRALCGGGVLTEDAQGRFATTPLGETLRSEGLRAIITTELGEEHYPAWGELLHSVRTGEIAFNKVNGMPVWEYFAKNPDNAVTFNAAMGDINGMLEEAISHAFDFSPFSKIVDVGGGTGSLLGLAMKANPSMRGVVFDLPNVIEEARAYIASQQLAERCEFVAGDFFENVPDGGDAYMLKWILHDWDDEHSVTILRNCRRAMGKDARLLIFEAAIPSGNNPFLAKFMDLNMMVMTGGRERTEQEYRSLFEAGGFNLTRVLPTHAEGLMNIIEGEPV
jgi:ubiquinone/menaquinone biosynthesis C-methylase UbiE